MGDSRIRWIAVVVLGAASLVTGPVSAVRADLIDKAKSEIVKQIDPMPHGVVDVSYQYAVWRPARIEGTVFRTVGLNILVVNASLSHVVTKLPLGFIPRLPSGRYEWTPGNLEQQRQLLNAQGMATAKASWERWLLKVPAIGRSFDDDNGVVSLDFDVESFAFLSAVTLVEDKSYVPANAPSTTLLAGSMVNGLTIFRKFSGVVQVAQGFTSSNFTLSGQFGYFHLDYRKPYAVTIGGNQASGTIFETDVEAQGFTFGLTGKCRVAVCLAPGVAEPQDEGLFAEGTATLDIAPSPWARIGFSGTTLSQFLLSQQQLHYLGAGADLSLSYAKRVGCVRLSAHFGGFVRTHLFFLQGAGVFDLPQGVNDDIVYGFKTGASVSF